MIKLIESYCAGVNAYIGQALRTGKLPVEFLVLGYQPTPWEPVDTISICKLLAMNLSQNFSNEEFRHQLRQVVDEELFDEMRPNYPADGPITVPSGHKWSGQAVCIAKENGLSDESTADLQ